MDKFNKDQPKQLTIWGILKLILLKVLAFFKFPHKVAKRYKHYNGAISEMYHEIRDKNLFELRKRNSILVNFCIYLPIFLGVFLSSISLYSHKEDFSLYYKKITTPIYAQGFTEKQKIVFKRIYFAATEIPFKKTDYFFILLGYSLAILGGGFLSLNPAFAKEEKIKEVFQALKFIDADGYPWRVTWTPDAIMITSFNNDPLQLRSNTRFWSSINFPPSNPKIFKNDMNKFIVYKRYELPASVVLEYKGEE